MKRSWLGAAALALLIGANAAMAADMPVPPPVYTAPPTTVSVAPVYNWTGLYLGAGGGSAIWNADTSVHNAAGAPLTGTNTQGGRGWLGTVVAGYDYQLGNHLIVGALADFDLANIKGSYSDPISAANGTMTQTSAWAAGARLGWLVFPELLAYVGGGFTQAHFSSIGLTPTGHTIPSHNYDGWFASIGLENTFPILGPGWFFRSDYRYSQYGSASLSEVNPAGIVANVQTIHPYAQTLTTALIYKLNSGSAATPGPSFSFTDFFRPVQPGRTDWSGFYVAAGGGYGTWNADASSLSPAGVPLTSVTQGGRGWFGTVNGGYDYQLTNGLVAGMFADFDLANIRGNFQDQNPAAPGPITGTMTENWAWAAGLRGGWLLTPQILNYYDIGFTQADFSSVNLSGVASLSSHNYSGWFLGGGVETALPFLGAGWFARLGYRYSKYEDAHIPEVLVGGGVRDIMSVQPYVQTVRTELVYRF